MRISRFTGTVRSGICSSCVRFLSVLRNTSKSETQHVQQWAPDFKGALGGRQYHGAHSKVLWKVI